MAEEHPAILAQLASISTQVAATDRRVACIDGKLDSVRTEDLPNLRTEVAALKVKAGVWGFAAGAVPTIAAILFLLLRDHL